jgi:hypothetical protein
VSLPPAVSHPSLTDAREPPSFPVAPAQAQPPSRLPARPAIQPVLVAPEPSAEAPTLPSLESTPLTEATVDSIIARIDRLSSELQRRPPRKRRDVPQG